MVHFLPARDIGRHDECVPPGGLDLPGGCVEALSAPRQQRHRVSPRSECPRDRPTQSGARPGHDDNPRSSHHHSIRVSPVFSPKAGVTKHHATRTTNPPFPAAAKSTSPTGFSAKRFGMVSDHTCVARSESASLLICSGVIGVLVFSAVLLIASAISGVARRSIMSTAVLFLFAGFVVGHVGFQVINVGPDEPLVATLAELALFAVLFTDGMRAGLADLKGAWRLPGRVLLVGMPVTFAITAVLAHLLGQLGWTDPCS